MIELKDVFFEYEEGNHNVNSLININIYNRGADLLLFWNPFPDDKALERSKLLKILLIEVHAVSGLAYKLEISLRKSIFGIIARVVINCYACV